MKDLRDTTLPTGSEERKGIPLATGVLDYFPAALAEVARLSKVGNDKHNPGEPLHHARGKSGDHADTIVRHLVERGTVDTDGVRHSVKVAWRALALLQEELEREEGAPLPRGARLTAPLPPPLMKFDTETGAVTYATPVEACTLPERFVIQRKDEIERMMTSPYSDGRSQK